MSIANDGREPEHRGAARGGGAGRDAGGGGAADAERPGPRAARGTALERLKQLMREFEARQRRCPNLVVRPWWSPGSEAEDGSPVAVGFVVEYCPGGVESAELAIRRDRVRVEGPGGMRSAALDLTRGWIMDGEDRVCRETLANYLLRMADDVLENAAA